MLLKKIILENFGVYGGRNEFNVTATPNKPVVLCWGVNGAGKTTLFESVPLCIYGYGKYEKRISQKQYHEEISKMFHRGLKVEKPASHAAISIEFQYFGGGRDIEYRVTREWHKDADGKVSENVSISTSDGKSGFVPLEIAGQEPQSILNKILPRGVTRLFFFNGEEIQYIADAGCDDAYVRASFERLLGLDIVKQLQDDISTYVLRNSNDHSKQTLNELEQNITKKAESDARIESIKNKQAFTMSDINALRKQLSVHEEKFQEMGGEFAKNREYLITKKIHLESLLQAVDNQIKKICSSLLPFVLLPDLLNETLEEISVDMKRTRIGFEHDILESAFGDVKKEISGKEFESDVLRILEKRMMSVPKSAKTTFDFSVSDMEKVAKLPKKITGISVTIQSLTGHRSKVYEKLKKVEASLEIVPKQDTIGPIFSDIASTNREIGELEGELNNLKFLETQEKSMIMMLNKKIRNGLSTKKLDSRMELGTNIASNVQDALEEYATLLRKKKIEILERYLIEYMQTLFHKKRFIENVQINPQTFVITLYDETGTCVNLNELSKGEMQIYATAVMWALAKTSGKPLPFIIDTPLARLDMQHRENMVNLFYPSASHQTIILATDSEISEPHYKALRNRVSRSMTIQYDYTQRRTRIVEGHNLTDSEVLS